MPSQKRKSKEQLAAEALRARKIEEGRVRAATGGKKKEKKPGRLKAMDCKCVGLERVPMKSPGKPGLPLTRLWFPVDWQTKLAGAAEMDRRFGKGRRLHNPGFVKGRLKSWTCVVCGDKKFVD